MNAFFRCSLVLSAACCLTPVAAWCDTYPSKPIRVIIAYSAGGITDLIVRQVGAKLTEAWSQPVVLEHRPGAGGALGADYVAKAAPDGYTLILGSSANYAVAPSLYSKLPYNPLKDFAPITMAVTYPNLLVVHPEVAANTVSELIALAKAKPGQLNYASAGAATSSHLAGELFSLTAGVKMVHVPYKGNSVALTDLVGGRVQLMFSNVGPPLPFVKSGRLRALGMTSAKRSSVLPDMPTVAESGLPGYEIIVWNCFSAPAGTPKDVISKLNTEIVKALRNPQVQSALLAQGMEAAPSSPEQLQAYAEAEVAKWARVVKEANIKVE